MGPGKSERVIFWNHEYFLNHLCLAKERYLSFNTVSALK
jgi:hypothetical protein